MDAKSSHPANQHSQSPTHTRALRLLEIARVLVRFNHVARFIVNANHSVMWTAETAGPL